MAITSIKTGSSFTNLIKYNDFLGPNAAYIPPNFESIATLNLSSGTTASFTSIPSTYKHLQIRGNFLLNAGGYIIAKFNSDTASNYPSHSLYGNGSTATSVWNGQADIFISSVYASGGAVTYPAVFIADIIDYASTTKNKTVRSFSGYDKNTSGGDVELNSGVWLNNTSGITSIQFATGGRTFQSGTTISLYGIN
jgi:hypothetical protein